MLSGYFPTVADNKYVKESGMDDEYVYVLSKFDFLTNKNAKHVEFK